MINLDNPRLVVTDGDVAHGILGGNLKLQDSMLGTARLATNASGDVAYASQFEIIRRGENIKENGIWLERDLAGTPTTTLVMRENSLAPGLPSTYFGDPLHIFGMDFAGNIAFLAEARSAPDGAGTNNAIWIFTPEAADPYEVLISTGDEAPGRPGLQIGNIKAPEIDHGYTETELVTFTTTLSNTQQALYVGKPSLPGPPAQPAQIELLVVTGETVTVEGLVGAVFAEGTIEPYGLSGCGQVVFTAQVSFDVVVDGIPDRPNKEGVFMTDVAGGIHALAIEDYFTGGIDPLGEDPVSEVNTGLQDRFNHSTISNGGVALFTTQTMPGDVVTIYKASATVVPHGDVNGDLDVDGQDLAILTANFGSSVPGTPGDLNNDDLVNGQDLAILSANFGNSYHPLFSCGTGGI